MEQQNREDRTDLMAKIIDFHTHCFPDEIALKAIPELAARAGIKPASDGTISGLLESMKEAGITASVVHSIATKPTQNIKVNDWAASIMAAGDGAVIPFATLHPAFEGWRNEVKRISRLGFKGVKFHPEYQDFYVNDKKMYPVYESIFNEGMMILFHAGVDIGFPGPYHCLPEMLGEVVGHFHGGRIIAAHMGGYNLYDDVEKYLAGRDLYFDTSYCLGEMGREKALKIIAAHGSDRILFASDSPWKGQAEMAAHLDALCLCDKDKAAISSGNAMRLLGLV